MCSRENARSLAFFLGAMALGAIIALISMPRLSDDASMTRADISAIAQNATLNESQITSIARDVAENAVSDQLQAAGLNPDQINATVEDAIIAFIKKRATESGQPSGANEATEPEQIDVTAINAEAEPVAGNPDARYQLIVFSDYECPFCKRFWPTVQSVIDQYGDDVAVTLRDYPLPMHGEKAQREAVAAQCAFKLGGNDAFWAYSDMIYTRTGSNGRGVSGTNPLMSMAEEAGLDADAFTNCLAGDADVQQKIENDSNEARQAGIRGTPSSILLDTKTGQTAMIRGARPLSSIASALDTLLSD